MLKMKCQADSRRVFIDVWFGQQDAWLYSKVDLNELKHPMLQFPACVQQCAGGLRELVNRK